MKIALVCREYSLKKGGLERYTVFLSRELLRAGHEVHIFANTWQPEQGIVFHHVPMFRLSSPGKNLSFAYFSNRELSKEKFSVIHSMERIFYQDIFRVSDGINPVQLLQRYPKPLVRRFKAIGPRRCVLSHLEHKIFEGKGCRFIMTNSELVKGQIIEHYNVDSGRINVIYNSVDISRFNPEVKEEYRVSVRKKCGIEEDEAALLFISNDFKLKGLQSILNAMTLLEIKTKLIVVGDDGKGPYMKWADRNGLGKRVLFLGHKSDIEKYYAACDIFVLPTRYDAFANVCLEAMACGVPVITTVANGAAELIRDGENGYILKTRESGELAGRIGALESPSERDRMGGNGAVQARRFTMEKHISEVLRLYERVSIESGI